MGKEVEGKGRQGKMDRDEQYEEARQLLTDALDLVPPGVYKASLFRDLCTCHTRLKRAEDAHDICGKHTRHDSVRAPPPTHASCPHTPAAQPPSSPRFPSTPHTVHACMPACMHPRAHTPPSCCGRMLLCSTQSTKRPSASTRHALTP